PVPLLSISSKPLNCWPRISGFALCYLKAEVTSMVPFCKLGWWMKSACCCSPASTDATRFLHCSTVSPTRTAKRCLSLSNPSNSAKLVLCGSVTTFLEAERGQVAPFLRRANRGAFDCRLLHTLWRPVHIA